MKKTRRYTAGRLMKSAFCLLLSFAMVTGLLSPELLVTEASAAEATESICADNDAQEAAYASDEVIIVYYDEMPEEETSDASGDASADASESVFDEAGVTAQEELTGDDTDGTAVLAQLDESVSVEEAIAILEEDPSVDYVQPNYSYSVLSTEDATVSGASDASEETQYYLYESAFTDAWEYTVAEGSVTIAVLDTGCNLDHEDLLDTVNTALAYDVTSGTLLSESGTENGGDAIGHGTQVCGVIAASAANGTGIAGASYNASLLPVKVFDENDSCTTADLIAAYDYLMGLIDDGKLTDLKVINISLGYYADDPDDEDQALETYISTMRDDYGVLTVCAGGNGTNGKADTAYCYPADFEECVSVTAVDADGANASFSDYNDAKDIAAYGVDIYTTSADGGYESATGTSMAAPQVASAAALLWAVDSTLSVSEVVSVLQETSDEVSGNLHETTMDNGIVNAAAAVRSVLGIGEEGQETAEEEETLAEDAAEEEEGQETAAEETLAEDAAGEDPAEETGAQEDAADAQDMDSAQVDDADSGSEETSGTSSGAASAASGTDTAASNESTSAADSTQETSEDETDPEIEEAFDSFRYSDGQVIDNANTDSSKVLPLTSAYSIWKKSYGTSYYGIQGTSSVTKVAVSGAVRIVIDVSKWQGEIDWEKVASSGVTAAIIRCGYGKNKTSYDDAYFLQNVQGALENGIEIGVYLYSYATTTSYAASEASHVLRLLEEAGLGTDDLALPVFLDMEDSTQGSLSASKLGTIAETFCDAIAAAGYPVGIYSSKNWWDSKLTDDVFDTDGWYKWVARYPVSSSVTDCGVEDADLWQFSSSGTVSGIDGGVDVSFDYLGSGSYLPSVIKLSSVTLSSAKTKVTVKWIAVGWADGYQIYRSTNSGTYEKVKTITAGTTVSWSDSTVVPGNTYKYKVRPYKVVTQTVITEETVTDEETGEETVTEVETSTQETVTGSFTAAKSVSLVPGTVTIGSAKTTSDGYVKVTWTALSDVTGYVIYRSVDGGSYTKVKTITSASTVSWTDKNAASGVYRYKILAYLTTANGTGYSASYSAAKAVTQEIPKVTISSVSTTSAGYVKVKWTALTNVTGYVIYRSVDSGSYTKVKTITKATTSSWTDPDSSANGVYKYKIRAYRTNDSGTWYSASYSAAKKITQEIPKVTISSASLTSSGYVKVKWTALSNVTGYVIYRSVDGGSYKKVKTIKKASTASWTDQDVSAVGVYKYKIRSYRTNGSGTWYSASYSAAKKATMRPSKVTISSVAATTTGYIKVKWKTTSTATGYVIYRSTDGGSYKKVKTIKKSTTKSWTDQTVKPGHVYRYKIRAYTKTGSSTIYSASYSTVKKARAKPAKTSITTAKSTKSKSMTIKWNKVSGASGYQVAYRIKGTSKWYYVSVKTAKKVFTSLRNKKYYVKVRAYKTYDGKKYYASWSKAKLVTVK